MIGSISMRHLAGLVVLAACARASCAPKLVFAGTQGSDQVSTADLGSEWLADEVEWEPTSDPDEVLLASDPEAPSDALSAEAAFAVDASALRSGLPAPTSSSLAAPQIGSAANPFSNTCDGRAIGFVVNPTGERPRMNLAGAPAGAVFQCRSGLEVAFSGQPAPEPPSGRGRRPTAGRGVVTPRPVPPQPPPFAPCDGADGSRPFHSPALTAEGTYRTEVRYVVGNRTSEIARVGYYVHHSLDRVACCQSTQPDTAWFQAARSLASGETFSPKVSLQNPFVRIAVRKGSGTETTKTLLSLRRTFLLSQDRKLLLIRRTMASRRTSELTRQNSCTGLTISEPRYGVTGTGHRCTFSSKTSEFTRGLLPARCPGVYCTVSTCEQTANGCTQITHTFNRGPGQQPWIVRKSPDCPTPSVIGFNEYRCDAYVLNPRGQAMCLVNDNGRIRAAKTVTDADATGLRLLGAQRSVRVPDRYVFSAKARRPTNNARVLYLPQ